MARASRTTAPRDPNAPPSLEDTDAQLAALESERQGYAARGLDDRVAQVDAEIDRLRS